MAAMALRIFAFGLEWLAQPGGQGGQANAERWRHPELRGLPLEQVMKGFCAPDSPAGRFNWAAERLFVDGDKDMTTEVSHLLARAYEVARTSLGADIAPALRRYADGLATSTELRASLALAVKDANDACDDRLGVSVGGLMLAGDMHRVRDPAADPADVVRTLVLYAATRAMDARLVQLLGKKAEPSAELLLTGYRAVQETMISRGLAVAEVFPERLFTTLEVRWYGAKVRDFAQAIAVAATQPGGPEQPAGMGMAELLSQYGGTASEEILSRRLARQTEPLTEELLHRLEEAQQLPTGQAYNEAAADLRRVYEGRLLSIRAQAMAGALAGDVSAWARPAEAASTSRTEPSPSHGKVDPEAEAPSQYDPVKGKWKVN
jgi:hypothetical protein